MKIQAIKNNSQLIQTINELRTSGQMTRKIAIRLHCLDCSGYEMSEIRKCSNINCPLYDYRTGTETKNS